MSDIETLFAAKKNHSSIIHPERRGITLLNEEAIGARVGDRNWACDGKSAA